MTHRLLRKECPFYRESRHALKVLSRLPTGLSGSRSWSSRALYCWLVRGAARADRWAWRDGEGGSLSMALVYRNEVLQEWWGFPHLAGHPECPLDRQEISCSAIGNFAWECPVRCIGRVYWLRLLSLCGHCTSFLKASCSAFLGESSLSWKPVLSANMVPKLNWQKHNVFLCLLGIMRVVIWTTRQKETPRRCVVLPLRPWRLFLSTKLKSKSGLRGEDSLRPNLAKGGWL